MKTEKEWTTEAEQIMKRCQAGTRNYEEANNLHAACYGIIGKLLAQRTWVGLTEGEQVLLARDYGDTPLTLIYAVGNMLKEKNNA
jgi:hypothetical protein